jgi:hypothetical protein
MFTSQNSCLTKSVERYQAKRPSSSGPLRLTCVHGPAEQVIDVKRSVRLIMQCMKWCG